MASREGFQLLVDAAGHKFTTATDFTNADWKAATRRTPDGYIVEIEVPLALIDVKDGPAFQAAGPGDVLNFALAATDNDAEVRQQTTYAYLRTPTATRRPGSAARPPGGSPSSWSGACRSRRGERKRGTTKGTEPFGRNVMQDRPRGRLFGNGLRPWPFFLAASFVDVEVGTGSGASLQGSGCHGSDLSLQGPGRPGWHPTQVYPARNPYSV